VARLPKIFGICLGVAFASWLLPASIHIVRWTDDGLARVALYPPLWRLWIALATAVIVALALAAAPARATVDRCLTPCVLLWLWVVPYLPWLPDRAPALLALSGPLRWGVAAMTVCGIVAAIVAGRAFDWSRILPGRRTVFVMSLGVYVALGLRSAAAVGPGADEPHYLVITQSLLRDHDLAIENNHARGDYREYFGGELRPDFLRRGLNEVIYSIHAPGLPALLTPAYAIGGYRGAVVMVALFGALAALAIFDLAALLAGAASAWVTWASVCLTVPFVPHSWLIFPEIPGALIVAWAALWLYAPAPSRDRAWIWRGLALGILPWLHTKFVILLAALGAALFLRIWRRPKAAAALIVPAGLSVALWLYFFYRLYGVFDPQVPYGDFPKLFVLAANIPRGTLGLLFDQKFGLLPYAPVYCLTIAGCWIVLRRKDVRFFAAVLLATIGAFVASSARMYMWWGGSSAPARFLVPILPLAAPLIAVAFHELRSAAARGVAGFLLLVSLAVAAVGVASPQRFMLFSAPHGLANIVVSFAGGSPLPYLLPMFTEDQVRAPIGLLAPWAIAGVIALAVVVAAGRRNGRVTGFAAAASGATAFFIMGAVLAGVPVEEKARRAIVQIGRLDVLRSWDPVTLRAYDYRSGAKLTEREVLDAGSVIASRADGLLASDPHRLAGPFDLPAGRFATRVTFAGAAPRAARIVVSLGGTAEIARGEVTDEAALPFSLPIDGQVWIGVEGEALAGAADQVAVVAESVVPRSQRPDVEARTIEAVDHHPGAFIVYADEESYPEGGVFWTKGTSAARVFVATGGASTLVLTLHVGPTGGLLQLQVDSQDRSIALSANQTQQIDVPLPAGLRLVPVVVGASTSFRPSDHEAGSTDRRWLGCQVRVDLR
jgi:hypothetical protein